MPERAIQIVGDNLLQNTLLAAYLREAIGARCDCRATLAAASATRWAEGVEGLVLIDCYRTDKEPILATLGSEGVTGLSGKRPALFNLRPETSIELEALRCGIRGFFYQDDPLASLAKGVLALFENDYWVSRKLLVEFLATPNSPSPGARHYPGLTLRESELLSLLVHGLSNQSIADKLFISVPTVKSHLSSIYRKIKVSSRLEALCWAERALIPLPPASPGSAERP